MRACPQPRLPAPTVAQAAAETGVVVAAVAAVVTIATPSSLPLDKHFQGWPFRVGPFSFAAQKPGTISGRAGHCGNRQVARGPQGPSGKTPSSVEGPPEKRGTFRENGLWHGRSPGKRQDLPGKRPPAWKVPREKAGPSRKMASGVEGPPGKGRTFQENGLWHGRSRGRSPAGKRVIHGKARFGGWKFASDPINS